MDQWTKKREEILKRDNFTCQICGQFNPELGIVELKNEDTGEIELHKYENSPNPFDSIYLISQSSTGYTFNINFGNCWPVFPIMQVHHKKYINEREYWDYNNDDLITLCKKCHTDLHKNQLIPIYSSDNILKEEKVLPPRDQGVGRKHQCDNWTFIKKIDDGEYTVSNINPTITVVLFEGEDEKIVTQEGKKVLHKFIKNFFPRYFKAF